MTCPTEKSQKISQRCKYCNGADVTHFYRHAQPGKAQCLAKILQCRQTRSLANLLIKTILPLLIRKPKVVGGFRDRHAFARCREDRGRGCSAKPAWSNANSLHSHAFTYMLPWLASASWSCDLSDYMVNDWATRRGTQDTHSYNTHFLRCMCTARCSAGAGRHASARCCSIGRWGVLSRSACVAQMLECSEEPHARCCSTGRL